MKDRTPTHAGRMRIVPVSGQTNIYDVTMADEPTELGTALNKGTLLSDLTAEIVGDEFGTTPDTPNEALALIGRGGKVGNIVRSLNTDMGENYALCNGDFYDPEECTEFAEIYPKNIFPMTNPNGTDVGAVTEMYNGEFVTNVSSYNQYKIISADGSVKGYVTLSDITSASGAGICGIDHNGSKYIVYVKTGSTAISVYSTADLSSYTLEKQVTLTHPDTSSAIIVEGDIDVSQKFDGTYYYYLRSVSGGRALAILDSSFNVLSDTSILSSTAGTLALRMCSNRVYAFLHDGNGTIGVKQISGNAPPTNMSGYRTVTWTTRYGDQLRVSEFNDSYDVMWQGSNYLAFIPRDGTSAVAPYSPLTSLGAVFLDGAAENLIVGNTSTTYAFCGTSAADPTQASAWGTAQFKTAPSYGQFYKNRFRHKESMMPYDTLILRAPLLPLITDDDAYVYVKIK